MLPQWVAPDFEQRFFRRLNAVVEPAVRSGWASPVSLPGGLIVLESTGFKTGKRRRTPLMSVRLGCYRIVSTVRGDRAYWVKNLIKQPRARYFVGGKARKADAIVVIDGEVAVGQRSYKRGLSALVAMLSTCAKHGMVFVVLDRAEDR